MPTCKIRLFFINVFVWMNIRSAWLYVYLNLMMLYLSGQTNPKKLKSFPNGQLPDSAFSLEEVFCTNELWVKTNSSLTKVDAIIWKILHVLCWRSQPCGWHPSATKTSSASPRQTNCSPLVSRANPKLFFSPLRRHVKVLFHSALCPLSAWRMWCWLWWLQRAPPRAKRGLRCAEGSLFVWPCPPAAVLAWEEASRTWERTTAGTPHTVSNTP